MYNISRKFSLENNVVNFNHNSMASYNSITISTSHIPIQKKYCVDNVKSNNAQEKSHFIADFQYHILFIHTCTFTSHLKFRKAVPKV